MPTLTLLAGANGADKTTFARRRFAEEIAAGTFVNADDVASGLAPDSPRTAAFPAARKMIARRRQLLQARRDLIVETTLASLRLARLVRQAKGVGFSVRLIFLHSPSPSLNVQRVAERVAAGGHHVPVDDVVRRHARGLAMLPTYLRLADEAEIYDVSASPSLVARKRSGRLLVRDRRAWAAIRAAGINMVTRF